MKVHRFYTPNLELAQKVWVHDERLLHQWQHVLRFRPGSQLVLFDGGRTERLYKIFKIEKESVGMELITELVRKTPTREIYLFWAPLKKDNNDFVLQKGTEVGVSHFVPVFAEFSVVTSFNAERAKKIVIEAAEQCGRSDIPAVREQLDIKTAIEEFSGKFDLFYADQSDKTEVIKFGDKLGVFIGPEGGWDNYMEREMFAKNGVKKISLGDFTLRAETAAIVAAAKLGGL